MVSEALKKAVHDLNAVQRGRMEAAVPEGGADPGLARAIADLNRVQAGKMAEALKDGGR